MCGISDTHGQIYYPTSEMMTGRCSIGCPGTSPSLNWCLKSWREILLTPFFSTHSILVFHGGDVFTDAKTVGMLSTAVKAPEISTDLFRKMPTLDWVQTESQWDINFLDLIINQLFVSLNGWTRGSWCNRLCLQESHSTRSFILTLFWWIVSHQSCKHHITTIFT